MPSIFMATPSSGRLGAVVAIAPPALIVRYPRVVEAYIGNVPFDRNPITTEPDVGAV
jgi:hypothetical protein